MTTDEWWCDDCQTDNHPQGSTMCAYLSPETIAWLKMPETQEKLRAARRTLRNAPPIETAEQ